ncbi:hypothetical protein EIP86_009303 [Pleurotus ostreatoroseus]|nr:hypothetical protein EIP86_009303 [Pleurotus ostreatoroseus]
MSTTLTSLLNSLHTHLQSQTQLLPALHNQLGLPATALADDLSVLQKELTECVERQIDTRRREVDQWMTKCEDVEKQCIGYANALGGNGKASGSSVGEIRKEQVLPKRFEMITEHQERLRQLYHTKLEHLTTLTNRLLALSRTLGPDFYPSDIFDSPSIASSDTEADIEVCRDVTPERFSKLEKELVRGKGEVSKRLNQLAATLTTLDWLYTELDIPPPRPDMDELAISSSTTLRVPSTRPPSSCSTFTSSSSSSDPFLSASTFATPTPATRGKPLTPMLLLSTSGREPPIKTASETEVDYQRTFVRFVARLEELSEVELANSSKPHLGLEGVDPTPGLISWAESTRIELEEIKRRREAHIQSLYDQLEILWRRLGVSDQEMDAFVEAQRGSTEGTVQAYEEELERMLELKRERMGTFVENARAEIVKLWDDLMVGEEERAEFAPFADDEFTEDLLTLHEDEIKSLKLERKLKGSLLTSIRKYFDILQDQKELAAAAADQTRLLGRGPRDPGRLLREEKMRKRVTKEKPRLEQDLLNTIPQWEAENGRVFLVHGRSIMETLMESAATHEKENTAKRGRSQSQSQTKPAAVPPRARTPSNPVHQYVPVPGSSHGNGNRMTLRSSATSSTSSSSTRSAPGRRMRLGEAPGNVPPDSAVRGAGFNRPLSPKKTSLPTLPTPRPRSVVAQPRSVSYQQTPTLGPNRGGNPRARNYHPYPQTRRMSPVKKAEIRVYGSTALNSNQQATSTKKTSRLKRESFKPRQSIDPDDNWASGSDKRFAGMLGGAVSEVDEFA